MSRPVAGENAKQRGGGADGCGTCGSSNYCLNMRSTVPTCAGRMATTATRRRGCMRAAWTSTQPKSSDVKLAVHQPACRLLFRPLCRLQGCATRQEHQSRQGSVPACSLSFGSCVSRCDGFPATRRISRTQKHFITCMLSSCRLLMRSRARSSARCLRLSLSCSTQTPAAKLPNVNGVLRLPWRGQASLALPCSDATAMGVAYFFNQQKALSNDLPWAHPSQRISRANALESCVLRPPLPTNVPSAVSHRRNRPTVNLISTPYHPYNMVTTKAARVIIS